MGRVAAIVLCGILLSGCASITRGTTEAFVIESDPVGAEVKLSNGLSCTTPCSLKMKRKSEFTVTVEKLGYKTVHANVTNQVAGGGAAGMAGNVLLGGLIGAAIDAGSGATLELIPNPLIIKMEPGEDSIELELETPETSEDLEPLDNPEAGDIENPEASEALPPTTDMDPIS